MAVTYSSALMAAAAFSFGAQADKEREASEWELLTGSVGLQLEEKASWRAARVHGGHPAASRLHGRPPNSKFKNSEGAAILPRKYA